MVSRAAPGTEGARPQVTDNFAYLNKTIGPSKAVAGIGDAAFRDAPPALHVLKGKTHLDLGFQIGLVPWKVTSKTDRQEQDLATWVVRHP